MTVFLTLCLIPVFVSFVSEWHKFAFRWGPTVFTSDFINIIPTNVLDTSLFLAEFTVICFKPKIIISNSIITPPIDQKTSWLTWNRNFRLCRESCLSQGFLVVEHCQAWVQWVKICLLDQMELEQGEEQHLGYPQGCQLGVGDPSHQTDGLRVYLAGLFVYPVCCLYDVLHGHHRQPRPKWRSKPERSTGAPIISQSIR